MLETGIRNIEQILELGRTGYVGFKPVYKPERLNKNNKKPIWLNITNKNNDKYEHKIQNECIKPVPVYNQNGKT